MKEEKLSKGCIYLLAFILYGSSIILLACAVVGLALPLFTQFCVGASILVFTVHITPALEKELKDNGNT
jgi:hypothetical protein